MAEAVRCAVPVAATTVDIATAAVANDRRRIFQLTPRRLPVDVLHPLARELSVAGLAEVETEHEALEAELEQLAEQLAGLPVGDSEQGWEAVHEFYLRFNRFVADYLIHIEGEERMVMPALAELADPERLVQLALSDYEGPVEMLVGAMAGMMPLFNLDDRRRIVTDIAAARTTDEFETVAQAGREALGERDWARLVE